MIFFIFVLLSSVKLILFPHLQKVGLVRNELAKLKKQSATLAIFLVYNFIVDFFLETVSDLLSILAFHRFLFVSITIDTLF